MSPDEDETALVLSCMRMCEVLTTNDNNNLFTQFKKKKKKTMEGNLL